MEFVVHFPCTFCHWFDIIKDNRLTSRFSVDRQTTGYVFLALIECPLTRGFGFFIDNVVKFVVDHFI